MRGLKQSLVRKTEIQDRLAWTIENGDPIHEVCIPHSTSRMGTARVK